jgi:hypothetical protein
MQHYPQSKFAADAKAQLAQVEKEKHDPLALLLMRDRRPSGSPAPEVQPDPSLAKLRDLNLVAKTEVVHENPGDEKGFLRRVADKLNPFSSSDNGKRDEQKQESAIDVLAKRNAAQKKEESSGMFASLWPFGKKDDVAVAEKETKASGSVGQKEAKASGFVGQIDESLKQKGIDSGARQQALKPPPADLPKTDDLVVKAPPATDTTALLSSIDGKLKQSGKDGTELPTAPEAAQAFKDVAATQAVIAKQTQSQVSQDVQSSGILSSIDQKLKAKGVEPGKLEAPPTAEEIKTAATRKPQARNVELEPKVTLEKGPLFLSPSSPPGETPAPSANPVTPQSQEAVEETAPPSRVLVKGPIQPQRASAASQAETRKPSSTREDEPKGALEQIRQDVENVGKALNPFRW